MGNFLVAPPIFDVKRVMLYVDIGPIQKGCTDEVMTQTDCHLRSHNSTSIEANVLEFLLEVD